MPVDPKTGTQLPYKGEPGYEQAKAEFPELYAQEEQATAGEQAPPPGMGDEPVEMAGDEGPMDAAPEAGMPMDMPAAPAPEKPYSVNAVKTLMKELNKSLDKLSGADIEDIEVELQSKGAKLEGSLPDEIYLVLVAIAETLRMLGEDFVDKYGFNPEELLTDADLRKATAMLKKMAKDKKLIEAMQTPVGDAEGGTDQMSEPSPPGFFDEDEQDLAANMA